MIPEISRYSEAEMDRNELLTAYTTDNPHHAELLRAALAGEGIRCQIEGEGQAGLTGTGIMEIRLVVRAEDFDRAVAYLKKHEPGDS